MENSIPQTKTKPWLEQHAAKFPALLFWAALIIGYQWYVSANNLTPLQAVQTLLDFFANSLWGMLIYVVVYAIRPLILFPATLITLAAGFVYGPFLGVVMVVVASNISSSIAYLVGRFFGQGLFAEGQGDGWVARYTRRMRQNSFETILTMRFIFLPYDAVSYLAGFLKIRYWPFILATALGSIPGTIAFVGFGASIETFDGAIPQLNPLTLGFSVAIFIISLVLSRVFKKRESAPLSSPHFALNFAQNGGNEGGHFHTIVIGAGSGGMTVAIGLAGLGKQVAFIEGNHVGGDCTNVGCVPSKTLIHLAREFKPGDNPDEILREVIRKRDALRDKETHEVREIKNVTFIEGWAKFTAPKEIEIALKDGGTRKITAENIVISTGARPRLLDIPGLPAERILTNESLFDLRDAPKHLVIVGAGVIALEMAFAFRKIGTQVTLFALDNRPLMTAIPEASAALRPEIERAGIKAYYGATATAFDETSRTLILNQGGAEVRVADVDKVLIAIGRVRNLERLELDKAGVTVDRRRGVLVNAFGETNVRGVYAIGDVTPTSAFTHSANAQGRRVVQRIAFPLLPIAKNEPFFPNATFSDPEVAAVGLTEQQLKETCHPGIIKRIRVDFKTHTDRGYTDGVENGFIIVDAVRLTGQILSVTIVGPRASEMISFFTLAMSQKISLYKIHRLVFPYPTYSSGILKVADFFMRETLTNLKGELAAYLKYRFARKN